MEEMFCTLDHEGTIKYISPSIQKKYNNKDFLIGTKVSTIVHPSDYTSVREQFIQSFKEVKYFEARIRLKRNAFEWKWNKLKAVPLMDDEKRVQSILIYLIDETLTDDNCEEAKKKQQFHYNNVPVMLCSVDLKEGTNSITGNPEEMFGFTVEEFNRNMFVWEKFVHPDDLIKINALVLKVAMHEIDFLEIRYIHPSGDIKWIQTKVIPIADSSKNLISVDAICIDITEQKRREENVKNSNLENQVIILLDLEGFILNVSPLSNGILTQFKDRWMDKSISELFNEKETDKLLSFIKNVRSNEVTFFQTTLTTKKGMIYRILLTAYPLLVKGKVHKILCSISYKNVYWETVRKLREGEMAIRKMHPHTEIGIWRVDLDTNRVSISKGIEKISGHRSKDLNRNPSLWIENIHKDDSEKLKKSYLLALSGSYVKHEYRIKTKRGEYKWLEESIVPVFNEEGKVLSLEGIVIDVNNRKNIQMYKTAGLYSSLISKSPTAIATLNMDGKITSVNKATQDITGYEEDELVGISYEHLLPTPLEYSDVCFEEVILSLKDNILNKTTTIINKSGEKIPLSVSALPLYNGESMIGLCVFGNDITGTIELEKTLLQSKEIFYEKYNDFALCIFILEFNKDSRSFEIMEVNQFACNQLNYSQSALKNQHFNTIVSPHFNVMKENKEYITYRSNLITKGGDKIPVFLYCHKTKWENRDILLTIARPIKNDPSENPTIGSKDYGRQLRILMAEMDINTMELANMTGLTTATISNLRTGKVKKPNIETASRIASVLGVEHSQIWSNLGY